MMQHTMNRIDVATGVEFDEIGAAFEKGRAAVRPGVGAETMFRHDPMALLYAPLRVLVYADDDGNAVFSMDQPSAAFGSLGIAEVTKLGDDLVRKVVNLLRVIGIDADRAFAQMGRQRRVVGRLMAILPNNSTFGVARITS